jgi:hypothetical protein
MTLCHRAFVFDYTAFGNELAPILDAAAESNQAEHLMRWVDRERTMLTLPWEDSELAEGWRGGLVSQSVREVAAIALTKYYDVGVDHGVGTRWNRVKSRLPESYTEWLLGMPLRLSEDADEEVLGYLLSPDRTEEARNAFGPYDDPHLREYRIGLDEAHKLGCGIYATLARLEG